MLIKHTVRAMLGSMACPRTLQHIMGAKRAGKSQLYKYAAGLQCLLSPSAQVCFSREKQIVSRPHSRVHFPLGKLLQKNDKFISCFFFSSLIYSFHWPMPTNLVDSIQRLCLNKQIQYTTCRCVKTSTGDALDNKQVCEVDCVPQCVFPMWLWIFAWVCAPHLRGADLTRGYALVLPLMLVTL